MPNETEKDGSTARGSVKAAVDRASSKTKLSDDESIEPSEVRHRLDEKRRAGAHQGSRDRK